MEKFHLLMENELEDIPELPAAEPVSFQKVKKAARRRTWTIVLLAAVLACAALVGGTQLYQHVIVPWLNDHYYYKPTIWPGAYSYTDLDVVVSAFTELTSPYYVHMSASEQNTGLGRYDLSIYQWGSLGWESRWLEGNIDKGIFTLPGEFFRETTPANEFVWASMPFYPEETDAETVVKAKERLAELPDYMLLTLAVSLDEDMSMDDFAALQAAHKDLNFTWAGIRTSDRDTQLYPLLGFNPDGGGIIYDAVNEQYACYELCETAGTGADLTTHYLSLLQLMQDEETLVQALCGESGRSHYKYVFDTALEYAQREGVYTYGFYVTGRPEALLPLLEKETICKVSIDSMELSILLYD